MSLAIKSYIFFKKNTKHLRKETKCLNLCICINRSCRLTGGRFYDQGNCICSDITALLKLTAKKCVEPRYLFIHLWRSLLTILASVWFQSSCLHHAQLSPQFFGEALFFSPFRVCVGSCIFDVRDRKKTKAGVADASSSARHRGQEQRTKSYLLTSEERLPQRRLQQFSVRRISTIGHFFS